MAPLGGRIERSEVVPIWSAFKAIPVERRPVDVEASLDIAAKYGIYAYDGYVLECAAALACPLLTLDGGMTEVARKMGLQLVELEL